MKKILLLILCLTFVSFAAYAEAPEQTLNVIENGTVSDFDGDGATLACGSGACACLAAAVQQNLSAREADLKMPGGLLHILWNSENHMMLTGEARTVFTGDWKA